jgi:rhodanese-related sulfurtransferase
LLFGRELVFWAALATLLEMQDLLAQGATVVDVRSPAEFATGHAKSAINIPLDELERRIGELDREKPVVLCCASGGRSGRACALLAAMGYNAHNAGPWANLPH